MSKADPPGAGGFLGRWSQRKRDAQAGRPLAEPAPASVTEVPASADRRTVPQPQASVEAQASESVASPPVARDLPTLADAQQLTPASDFQPFMSEGVASEVRNAAMKKLFTDPHFNVMDGLDIYIGDYNTPDPLPPEMLRQMVGAQFLGLWEDEAPKPPTDSHASLPQAPESAEPSTEHDHTDLRLQPNPTPADADPEPRAG